MNKSIFESRRRSLYPNGPDVSSVGFGSYRIGFSHPEHADALESALRRGLNLIDTSSNYSNGESEELIGQVISKLISKNVIERNKTVLVTKCGYLQGAAKDFPEISSFGDHFRHCIHPEFILDQIEISLKRLNTDYLDVYLLHNPEYMLKRFELDGMEKSQAQDLFYQRIKESFLCLENLVSEGKIKSYGVSSNYFGSPNDDFSFVSLKKLHDVAISISDKNHFKVVEMPLNWLEVSPLFYELEDTNESTISYAQKNKIGVLINRPFNAMFNDSLIRLTRPQIQEKDLIHLDEDALRGFENWKSLASDLEQLAHKQLEDVPGYEDASLSQLALATLVWLPGVSSVLCGMRQERYVTDAAYALSRPALLSAKNVLYNIYENLEFHN